MIKQNFLRIVIKLTSCILVSGGCNVVEQLLLDNGKLRGRIILFYMQRLTAGSTVIGLSHFVVLFRLLEVVM